MRTADTLKTGHRIGSGSVKVTYKTFMTASLVYLMIPVIIFFLGYLKLFPGIAFTLLTILAAVWTIRGMHTGNDGTIKDDGRYSIEISNPRLAGMILMTVAFIYLGGIGEFGWGTTATRYPCFCSHRAMTAVPNEGWSMKASPLNRITSM